MNKINYQKTALVTGSSKGIGKAIALKLALEGYFVYVTYCTDKSGGLETIKEIEKNKGKALLKKVDVSEDNDVKELLELIKNNHGHLDVLVNNATRSIDKRIEDSSFDEWKLAIDSKLHGSWLCTKYSIPLLQKSSNANIIFITSSADERPSEDIISYAVATGATNCFFKAITPHLSKYGIRVNSIMAGQTRTDNWGSLKNDDKLWKSFADQNPLKRVTTVNDITDAIMFLINDPHKYINGNQFYVNGGGHLK